MNISSELSSEVRLVAQKLMVVCLITGRIKRMLINRWFTFARPVNDENWVDPEIGEMPPLENQVS